MFICKPCLDTKTNNLAFSFYSRGPCEFCNKVSACVDIPSKYIEMKPVKKETDA